MAVYRVTTHWVQGLPLADSIRTNQTFKLKGLQKLGNGFETFPRPRAPSYLNRRLLGYVTIGYIVHSSHYLGNWSPRKALQIEEHELQRASSSSTFGLRSLDPEATMSNLETEAAGTNANPKPHTVAFKTLSPNPKTRPLP